VFAADAETAEDVTMSRRAARFRRRRTDQSGSPLTRGALVILLTVLIIPSLTTRVGAQEATPQATPVAAHPAPVWTQVGPHGSLEARTLVDGACPEITLDGSSRQMSTRVGPNGANFPETVCETTIPAGTKSASIAGQPLALLPTHLARIAVIGDAGCRIEDDWVQDCSDPEAWPFATVAAQLAAWQPDLIIHVGDYLYRESACPANTPGCAGSPWGDKLATWQADLFDPAAAALPVAPWLFVRGNHEDCDRAGEGWFRYLAAGPLPAECEQFSPSWTVEIDARSFLVLDTSATEDVTTKPEIDAAFTKVLDHTADLATPGVWLLTHKPLTGGLLELSGKEQVVKNATLQSISKGALPPEIAVVLSGHIHLAEALSFERASGKPFQIIAGNSGTKLDNGENATYTGAALDDPELNTGIVGAEFGWTAVELKQDRAIVTSYRLDGSSVFRWYLPAPE
jgi:predicted phosphodiesterase